MQANILGVSNTLTDAQKKNPSVNLTLAQNCRFAASCLVTEARGLAPDTSSFDVYFADIKLAPDTKGNVVWLLDAWEPVGSTPGHGFSMFTYGNVV